jgi:NAD(P)-dependent dehydrogenase (short-subunit alcohol dehydrogenase family)
MNLFDLSGKTALITGASGGLGERFARTLSQAGARVILAARRKDRLESITQSLKNALPLEMDVADPRSVRTAFQKLDQAKEKVDICINNAGIARTTPLFESDGARTWYVTHSVANHMKAHSIEGSIINIGSVNGELLPAPTGTGYSASKAAVIHFAKTTAVELAPYKIRVNTICPGFFITDMTKETRENFNDFLLNKIPIGFIGDPSDLDGAVLFLASNRASRYVTGSCITVDGGISWSKLN